MARHPETSLPTKETETAEAEPPAPPVTVWEGMATSEDRRRRRFFVMCALLHEYVREHRGQMGDHVRWFQALTPPVAPVENDDRTMQLFPLHPPMAQPAQERPEVEKAPMTIFYGDQITMFNNFPEDKAKELMQMAQSVIAPPPENVAVDVPEMPKVTEPSAGADQPSSIARKASLQRFLEKRKERINDTDPDHNEDASPSKRINAGDGEPMEEVPDALWLRL